MMLRQIGSHSTGLRLAAVLAWICLIAVGQLEAVKKNVQDNFFYEMRIRTGYFSRCEGYLDIFKGYSTNVIQRVDKSLGDLNNDWREVRPTGEFCVTFLRSFQIRDYILTKPYDLIPLDACLDWLYWEDSEKEEDIERFSVSNRGECDQLNDDPKLRQIYDSTGFKDDSLPEEIKAELFKYFSKLIGYFAENPMAGCHSLWLEAYNDFIEDVYLKDCEEDDNCEYFGLPDSMNDSYLKLVVESTKDASQICYEVMQEGIVPMMEDRLSPPKSFWSRSSSKNTPASKQAAQNNWGEGMLRVLQLASDTESSQPVDLVKVVLNLERLKNEDRKAIKKFTKALGEYALTDKTIDVAANDDDFSGTKRFAKSMSNLCRPFMLNALPLLQSDDQKTNPFEFYSIVYSLVRLTNHESLFGITKTQFEEDILENHWEALYLAVFACQLISTSHAVLNYDKNKPTFAVGLKPSAHILIDDWPIEVLREKIPSQMPDPEESASDEAASVAAAPAPVRAPAPPPPQSQVPAQPAEAPQHVPQVQYVQAPPYVQHTVPQYALAPAYQQPPYTGHEQTGQSLEKKSSSIFSRFKFPKSFGRSEEKNTQPPPQRTNVVDDVQKITGLSLDTLLEYRETHGKWPSKVPVDMIPSLEQVPRDKIVAKMQETRLQFAKQQELYKQQLEAKKRETVPAEPDAVPLAFNFKRKVAPNQGKRRGRGRGSTGTYDSLKGLDS